MMTKATLKVSHYLVILVDGLHAGATGGAAVLGILGHGHHMLNPIFVNLLQSSLSERPETILSLSCSGHAKNTLHI